MKAKLAVLAGFLVGVLAAVLPAAASRNSSGVYSLPAGNPVVPGTTIGTVWANATLADIKQELTNSLDRGGRGAMTAPLPLSNGTVALPGLTWGTDSDTGLYRIGANNPGMACGGVKVQEWATTGTTVPLGLTATQSQTNTSALTATGNGTGKGISAAGGASDGTGGVFQGGSTNGVGVVGLGAGSGAGGTFGSLGTGIGVDSTGGTGAVGLKGTGGSNANGVSGFGTGTGYGVAGTGGATNGPGMFGLGVATGTGVMGQGGATSGTGASGQGGAPNGAGVLGVGTGSGYGGFFTGGGTGGGLTASGGGTSGVGGTFVGTGGSAAVDIGAGHAHFSGSNPASTVAFSNTQTPLNTIKSFGNITTGASPSIGNGFSVTSASCSSQTVTVTLAQAMGSTAYTLLLSSNASGNRTFSGNPASSTTFTVVGYDSGGSQIDLCGVSLGFNFLILGAQ